MDHLSFNNSPSFSLDNFEGTLELLFYLIQKEEIDVLDVTLQELTKQLIQLLENTAIETTAEQMGIASTLLLLKSQKLLPNQEAEENEIIEDLRGELIKKLIEYSQFRDTAKTLLSREEQQKAYFPRGTSPQFRKELGTGLEEVDLKQLKTILTHLIKRAEKKTQLIQKEEWEVAPKIVWLKEELARKRQLPFEEIFSENKCRDELIVSFLALLELMKLQELKIVKEGDLMYIIVPYESQST